MPHEPEDLRAPSVARTKLQPNYDHIVIEDDEPVDGIFAEKQQRLLTEPLRSSWKGPPDGRSFLVFANVGLFIAPKKPPLVPDVMLSLGVTQDDDLTRKENNTYFVWTRGKVPDTVIEIVSEETNDEDTTKLRKYAQWGIPYYVVFDPFENLKGGVLRAFALQDHKYQPLDPKWFPGVGLGVILWDGVYEGLHNRWLRWCDAKGKVIPTGAEGQEKERAKASKARARANAERANANKERLARQKEQDRAERLAAQLRAAGIEPEQ